MSERPNILLIHADQHRYDCMGAYGNKEIKTPNIDALAMDGVLFENSFCSFPVCTPSRYSLLSGQYVHQHHCSSNRSTLAPDIPTLPRALRENGYRTAAVGKMHFTPTYLDVGFDDMQLAEQCGDGRYDDDYHRWLRDEGLCDRLDMIDQVGEFRKDAPGEYWERFGAFQSDLDEEHHSTTWIGDQAITHIDQWKEDGNLLMVGFIKPHHPFDPPPPWDTMYDPDQLSLLPGWTDALVHHDNDWNFFPYSDLTEPALRHVMALYYATITQIDHHVGRMITRLKEKGLYENTIIVYTSDHGDYMGHHHRLLKSNSMFDPLIRVPLIVKYPSSAHAQERDTRLVNNIDLAPTLLSLAGLTPPDTMQGIDLSDPHACVDHVFAETGNEYMVRSKTRKLLLRAKEEESMFFDLERDPLEMDNLFGCAEYQAEIAALRNQLADWPAFDEQSPNSLDLDAPQCAGDNVPRGDTGLYDYFKSVMTKYAGRPLDGSSE